MSEIPYELRELEQWVCWGVDMEHLKMPYDPRDLTKPAKAGDPSTISDLYLNLKN